MNKNLLKHVVLTLALFASLIAFHFVMTNISKSEDCGDQGCLS